MQEIIATSAYLRTQLQALEAQLKEVKTCVECDFFNPSNYFCKKFNSQVPAKVIIVGCKSFRQLIPF